MLIRTSCWFKNKKKKIKPNKSFHFPLFIIISYSSLSLNFYYFLVTSLLAESERKKKLKIRQEIAVKTGKSQVQMNCCETKRNDKSISTYFAFVFEYEIIIVGHITDNKKFFANYFPFLID